jgi:hypothetical protein
VVRSSSIIENKSGREMLVLPIQMGGPVVRQEWPLPSRSSPCADIVSLTPNHGIRYALGVSLWGRWRLKLTSRGRCNGTFCRTIGDAIERVSNARQFKCKLVDSARPLQYDNSFSAEVKSDPEHQPNHEGYARHEDVMTCDRETSARNGNHVV